MAANKNPRGIQGPGSTFLLLGFFHVTVTHEKKIIKVGHLSRRRTGSKREKVGRLTPRSWDTPGVPEGGGEARG